ncbi:hypothetical protein F9222_27010, partial [Escherichia coli]
PMEASVNPSHRRLRLKKWEASPDRAGSSHLSQFCSCFLCFPLTTEYPNSAAKQITAYSDDSGQ